MLLLCVCVVCLRPLLLVFGSPLRLYFCSPLVSFGARALFITAQQYTLCRVVCAPASPYCRCRVFAKVFLVRSEDSCGCVFFIYCVTAVMAALLILPLLLRTRHAYGCEYALLAAAFLLLYRSPCMLTTTTLHVCRPHCRFCLLLFPVFFPRPKQGRAKGLCKTIVEGPGPRPGPFPIYVAEPALGSALSQHV